MDKRLIVVVVILVAGALFYMFKGSPQPQTTLADVQSDVGADLDQEDINKTLKGLKLLDKYRICDVGSVVETNETGFTVECNYQDRDYEVFVYYSDQSTKWIVDNDPPNTQGSHVVKKNYEFEKPNPNVLSPYMFENLVKTDLPVCFALNNQMLSVRIKDVTDSANPHLASANDAKMIFLTAFK